MMPHDDSDDADNIVSFGPDADQADPPEEPEVPEPPEPTGAETTRVVSVHLEEYAAARESLARLETRLESAQEDVRRAVEYARELEDECDRLATALDQTNKATAQVRSELDEERGRREELGDQFRHVLSELEELSGVRGKYHLERGRREQAEAKADSLGEDVLALLHQVDKLSAALEEAARRGYKVEVGPVTIELKR